MDFKEFIQDVNEETKVKKFSGGTNIEFSDGENTGNIAIGKQGDLISISVESSSIVLSGTDAEDFIKAIKSVK